VRIARAGANIIGEAAPFGSTHRSLFRLDQPRRPIIEFEIPAPIQVISDQGPLHRLRVQPPFAPQPRWTITSTGEIAFWPGTGADIRLLAVSGQPAGSLALPPERIAVHTADRRIWLQNTFPPGETLFGIQDAYRGLRAAAERSVSFPPHFPPVLRLLPDPAGGVWVLRAQRADGEIWTLLRQGQQPRSIAGPGERAIVAFGRDVIVMQTRSRDDVEIIELYARPQLQ
jgi:hypothetical protein